MGYINYDRFIESFSSTARSVTEILENILEPYKSVDKLEKEGISDYYIESLKKFHQFDFSFVVKRGGKRIRPYMLITVAEGNSCRKRESLLYISCAPEIIHNATLEHDDIMDKDIYRSNKPTVRKLWMDFLTKNSKKPLKHYIKEKVDFMTINNGDKLT
jgi:geranylgeranyl pyrophosphate synthase